MVLALSPPTSISLLNCLETRLIDLQPDSNPSQLLVRLGLGPQTMLARVSRRSATRLGLRENQRVYALIKGVAMR
ncbi:MAG: TOBE domain-containing protein [Pseudomonadota bacterium]|nr:TOBE domain-containing protein [Pseudomonadota bacterium]